MHSNLTLAGNQRWLALASRESFAEAAELAKSLSENIPNVVVLTSKSGWFAIASGPHALTALAEVKASIGSPPTIPSDAYLTRGDGYIQYVWRPAPPMENRAAQSAPVNPLPQPARTNAPEPANQPSSRLGSLIARAEQFDEIRDLVAHNRRITEKLKPVHIDFENFLRVAKETCRINPSNLEDNIYNLRYKLGLYSNWDGNKQILPTQVAQYNKFALWAKTFKCYNQISSEEAYNQYLIGTIDRASVENIQNTVGWMEMGAVLGDVTSQLMLSARYLYPANLGNLSTSPRYGIDLRGHEKLDRSGALAWGLLAALSGSKEAVAYLERRVLPLLTPELEEEGLSLLKKHARLRFENLEYIEKRKRELAQIADRIVPTIKHRTFEGMTVSNAQRYARFEAEKILIFFREASSHMSLGTLHMAREACGSGDFDRAINANGPDAIVREFLTETWQRCLVHLDKIAAEHGPKMRRHIIENGT